MLHIIVLSFLENEYVSINQSRKYLIEVDLVTFISRSVRMLVLYRMPTLCTYSFLFIPCFLGNKLIFIFSEQRKFEHWYESRRLNEIRINQKCKCPVKIKKVNCLRIVRNKIFRKISSLQIIIHNDD